MKVAIVRGAVILLPLETAVVLIGMNMSKEASDLAMGIIIGLAVVLVAFIISWFVRAKVQDRQREEARQAWHSTSVQQTVIEADWRYLQERPVATPTISVTRNNKQIASPQTTRALMKKD